MKTIIYFLLLLVIPARGMAQAGSLDPEFGINGITNFSLGADQSAISNHVFVQTDDKLLITGSTEGPDDAPQGVLLRYLSNGMPDVDFGNGGKVLISYPGNECYAKASIQLEDGRLLTLVSLDNLTGDSVALFRFHADGSTDTSFGHVGVATLFNHSTYFQPSVMALQTDGKIVVSGYTGQLDAGYDQIFVTRFRPDGSIDTDFGDDGISIMTIGESYTNVSAILIQPNGKIITAGYCRMDEVDCFAIARFTVNGLPDPTFDQDGQRIIEFQSGHSGISDAVLQPDGKIVVGGFVFVGSSNSDFAAARFLADGTLDASFNDDGIVLIPLSSYSDRARGLILQPDGKVVLGGFIHSNVEAGGANMALVRLTTDGYPDSFFDEDGIAECNASPNSDMISKLAMQSDGKIVAAGHLHLNAHNKIAVARFLSGVIVRTEDYFNQISEISIYPNPVSEQVNIHFQLDQNEMITIQLVDINGRVITTLLSPTMYSHGIYAESFTIPESLRPGNYFVSLLTNHGTQAVKVVVE